MAVGFQYDSTSFNPVDPDAPCVDEPGWARDPQTHPHYRTHCQHFVDRSWCWAPDADGSCGHGIALSGETAACGHSWVGEGAAVNFPEKNCCVCGGSAKPSLCVRPTLSLKLICKPYTVTDTYKRMCSNGACTDPTGPATQAASASECTATCQADPVCRAVTLIGTLCQKHAGDCLADEASPFGKPVTRYSFDYSAKWTPVEMEHPADSAQLMSFEPSRVEKQVT